MLENRPDRDIGPLGHGHDRGRRAGLGNHRLGGRDDLAARLGRAPIASVGHDHFAYLCHGVAARHYRCFVHFQFPIGVKADGSQRTTRRLWRASNKARLRQEQGKDRRRTMNTSHAKPPSPCCGTSAGSSSAAPSRPSIATRPRPAFPKISSAASMRAIPTPMPGQKWNEARFPSKASSPCSRRKRGSRATGSMAGEFCSH